MWKSRLLILALVTIVFAGCGKGNNRSHNEIESANYEMHNVSVSVTMLMADPDRPVELFDEFPTNSFIECNPEGGACTKHMAELASINSGIVGKYGINEGSSVANYMQCAETEYWYCIDTSGHVTGYWADTCLPKDKIEP